MKRVKAALAAGALVVAASTAGVIAASSAGASIPDPESTLRSQQYFVDPGSTVVGSASCVSGETLLSGGYLIPGSGAPYVTAYYSYPDPSSTPDAWNVGFQHNGGSAIGSKLVTIFALCAVLD